MFQTRPVDTQLLETILRLGCAGATGMIIGVNRDLMNKPMGMRTLGLVALGAAMISLAGIEFRDLSDHPDSLSRVVQGVIQGVMGGISFIGAGVILRHPHGRHVEGLTTAATVWVAAALGVACALAAWRVVAVGLLLALVLLVLIGWLERHFSHLRPPDGQ
jgi:putative Mg2+ transporter-C (MgtC) family protein